MWFSVPAPRRGGVGDNVHQYMVPDNALHQCHIACRTHPDPISNFGQLPFSGLGVSPALAKPQSGQPAIFCPVNFLLQCAFDIVHVDNHATPICDQPLGDVAQKYAVNHHHIRVYPRNLPGNVRNDHRLQVRFDERYLARRVALLRAIAVLYCYGVGPRNAGQAKAHGKVSQISTRSMRQRRFIYDMYDVHGHSLTISHCIHQTWKTEDIPDPKEWPDSWKRLNPGWDYRLWTDSDLRGLVHDHYPELEDLYLSYPNPVQRADMGRYLILHHCGGVYADLDTECVSPLDVIAQDTRVILAEEPIEHHHHATRLGLSRVIFNGVMASPKGHPFWEHLIALLVRSRHASGYVLESTGPVVLTSAVATFDEPDTLAIQSCHLFNPLTDQGWRSTAVPFGDYAGHHICNHYWRGSWYRLPTSNRTTRMKRKLRKAKYNLTRGPFLGQMQLEKQINMSVLHRPVAPTDTNVSILIPVRDAEPFLDRCFALLLALDYPKDQLKIVFCEGDSTDHTTEKLAELADKHRSEFRDIIVTRCVTGAPLDRSKRWLRALQLARRSNLAKVRNHLIDRGIADDDHWALWIDVDVCDYDSSVLKRLLAERTKVVTPDCVLEWGGKSYDLNAFHDDGSARDHTYYKYVKRGLFMPPVTYRQRRPLHALRCLERVPLSSVGGTMLLVHAAVHRAGVRFPEIPYDDLLETEGFGRSCRDFGVTPIGLPNVQIKHVKS